MHLPPAEILNKIARTTRMRHSAAIMLFMQDQQEQNRLIRNQSEKLEANGCDPLLITSYTTLAPMLAERDAITEFLSRPENSDWIGMIPNPCDPMEAALLARLELPQLDDDQMEQFRKMMDRVM